MKLMYGRALLYVHENKHDYDRVAEAFFIFKELSELGGEVGVIAAFWLDNVCIWNPIAPKHASYSTYMKQYSILKENETRYKKVAILNLYAP
ncbi:MAG: hypothetical protein AAF492_15290, partial [Verrucomicrobiota bacterium]